MLIGTFEQSLGEKNRLAIPKKLREKLNGEILICKGFEQNLMILDTNRWNRLLESVSNLHMLNNQRIDLEKFLGSSAFEISYDEQGRFVLPETLKSFAEINDTTIFVGSVNWIEIWSKVQWIQKEKKLQENLKLNIEKIAK